MISKAISKINEETKKSKNNPYVQIIGDFLLKHLDETPEDAERIIASDKTIAKSLDAMKAEARKKQLNGCGILTDQEGFAIVLKYFGIKATGNNVYAKAPSTKSNEPKSSIDFDVKLEELL